MLRVSRVVACSSLKISAVLASLVACGAAPSSSSADASATSGSLDGSVARDVSLDLSDPCTGHGVPCATPPHSSWMYHCPPSTADGGTGCIGDPIGPSDDSPDPLHPIGCSADGLTGDECCDLIGWSFQCEEGPEGGVWVRLL